MSELEKDFTPYTEALALKTLGFDEPCFNRFYTKPQSKMFGVDEKGRHYPIKNTSKKLYIMGEDFVLNDSNVISAPTFSQAFRWFREKYKLYSCVFFENDTQYYFQYVDTDNIVTLNTDHKTYEEAELACLRKLIEIVKQTK